MEYLETPCPHCGQRTLFPPADDFTPDQGADGYLSTVTCSCDTCEARTPVEDVPELAP